MKLAVTIGQSSDKSAQFPIISSMLSWTRSGRQSFHIEEENIFHVKFNMSLSKESGVIHVQKYIATSSRAEEKQLLQILSPVFSAPEGLQKIQAISHKQREG